MNWKSYCLGMLTVYLFSASMTGIAISRAIPALNLLGATYIGAAWPAAMFCAVSQIQGCTTVPPAGSPLANAFFTFKD